ncbi:Protein RDM16 [Frankliniella fusca]|uniref:Protein RDM16 n=1 Tax=Frankliniella fusca TaxID=407009 RepID=A0AAE1LAX0_9NEOP|nr:Protein RDM16 [Frankliniella fusca]
MFISRDAAAAPTDADHHAMTSPGEPCGPRGRGPLVLLASVMCLLALVSGAAAEQHRHHHGGGLQGHHHHHQHTHQGYQHRQGRPQATDAAEQDNSVDGQPGADLARGPARAPAPAPAPAAQPATTRLYAPG